MMDATSQASFLRALLLVIATAGYQLSSTTPAGELDNKGVGQNGHSKAQQENGSSSVNSFGEKLADKDVVHDAPNSLLTRMAPSTKSMQSLMWTLTSIEVLVRLLAVVFPQSGFSLNPASALCPVQTRGDNAAHGLETLTSFTILLLTFTIITGASIRRACFRALGRNFTFAHVTREKHSLVTWGPYAYARHASYTGLAMTHFGIISVLWSDGGWMRECAALGLGAIGEVGTIGGALLWGIRVVAVYFTVWNAAAVFALLLRAPREDLTLKAKFGKEWETYREKVPWRFVPYVI